MVKPATPPADSTARPAALAFGKSRGRDARHPSQIPLRGWRDILRRTWAGFNDDHITIIAGGVTFSVLLAIFPALGAFVALYGLVADASRIPAQLQTLSVLLPAETVRFIGGQMLRLAQARHSGLSFAFFAGLLISLWSANGAMKAILVGMNVAYEQTETRGLVRLNLTSLAFALGLMAFFTVVTGVLGAGSIIDRILGPDIGFLVGVARWPCLLVAFAGGIAILYRYGPSRPKARWRWITWGSAVATGLWLIASLLFSLYVSALGSYDRTYGPLGAIVALMVWIWISTLIVLAGAELNAEIERQAGVGALGKGATVH